MPRDSFKMRGLFLGMSQSLRLSMYLQSEVVPRMSTSKKASGTPQTHDYVHSAIYTNRLQTFLLQKPEQ